MDHERQTYRRPPWPTDEGGFSMVATVLSLVVGALALALVLGTTLHSTGTSPNGVANAPGVAQADRIQAQQSLTTGLTAAQTLAAGAGGLAGVTAAELQSSNPSLDFVSGASSGPTTVSVAVSGESGGVTPGAGDTGGASSGIAGIAGIAGATGQGGDGGGGGTGSITLADRSSDGVCWLVWSAGGTATWYGAQTGLASCSAPSLSAPPTPGPVTSSTIGWQQASFPSA